MPVDFCVSVVLNWENQYGSIAVTVTAVWLENQVFMAIIVHVPFVVNSIKNGIWSNALKSSNSCSETRLIIINCSRQL